MTQEPNNEWPAWAKNINIYEVNIRQYTVEGTFNAFSQHLHRLKKMGVDVLWLMPIFPISLTKRKGILGSYYAVSDYRKINPEFGTITDFLNLVNAIHALEMRVIIDWVPNHTGWDHPWIQTQKEFYKLTQEGEVSEPLDNENRSLNWHDVAALNYDNKAMRESMINDMLYCLNEYKIDGFRQDMAMLVPLDFWQKANQRLRSVKPDLLLLAESEDAAHLEKGLFNLVYSWSLHHHFTAIAQGKQDISVIEHWLKTQRTQFSKGTYIFFTSNHDENSWSGSEIERLGEAYKAFAILTMTLDGVPLIYSGQEEPMPQRLEFFEKDCVDYKDYALSEFYRKMLHLKHQNKALWNETYGGRIRRIIPHKYIFAFQRIKEHYNVTVIINLSNQLQYYTSDTEITGNELFTAQAIQIPKDDKQTLKPWSYLVIHSS